MVSKQIAYTFDEIQRLIRRIKSLITELSHVISKVELKKALGATALLFGFALSNQATAQTFAAGQKNPFGLEASSLLAMPEFADIDNDGDLDLFVAEYGGLLRYYKNVGTATTPQFAKGIVNPYGLDTMQEMAPPTFGDLDDDGDYDLLLGGYYGELIYYRNTGTPTSPKFARALINPFGLDSADEIAYPTFVDLDKDGDLDLMVGEYYGGFQYYENIGTKGSPSFAKARKNPFDLISANYFAIPAFADLDEDGDLDLLVGEYEGKIIYYKNIGTATSPKFESPTNNSFGIKDGYYIGAPAFADLDNDGDMDLLVGEYYGNMHYYKNTTRGVGVDELHADQSFLSPNPTNGVLYLNGSSPFVKLQIMNQIGQEVAHFDNPGYEISITDLANGIYTIKAWSMDGFISTQKVNKF